MPMRETIDSAVKERWQGQKREFEAGPGPAGTSQSISKGVGRKALTSAKEETAPRRRSWWVRLRKVVG